MCAGRRAERHAERTAPAHDWRTIAPVVRSPLLRNAPGCKVLALAVVRGCVPKQRSGCSACLAASASINIKETLEVGVLT